jgi:hypothetical protein
MKTLGDSMGKFLSLLIFKIILVLYILYLVVRIIVNIGAGSISGRTAHQRANLEELNKSLIGSNTTDLVQNLKRM